MKRLFFLSLLALCFATGCGGNEPTIAELKQGFVREVEREFNRRNISGRITDVRISKVRQGVYDIYYTTVRYYDGATKTWKAKAVVDNDGGVDFYME